jgi:hypothetical protein
MSMSRKLMPICGLPSLLVRTRQKIHSPYWPSVVQVFWPLTMYLSPLAFCLALDGGQVAARVGLAVTLAPPDLAAGDAGQEALLLFGIAKGHDHRRHHHRAEGHHARRAGQRAFFFEQVLLDGVPARAAKLLGPAPTQPALLAQDLGPALQVVAAQAQRMAHLVADVGWQVLAATHWRTSCRKASSSAVKFRSISASLLRARGHGQRSLGRHGF